MQRPYVMDEDEIEGAAVPMDNHELQRRERQAYEILNITMPVSPNFDSRMADWKAFHAELRNRSLPIIREF